MKYLRHAILSSVGYMLALSSNVGRWPVLEANLYLKSQLCQHAKYIYKPPASKPSVRSNFFWSPGVSWRGLYFWVRPSVRPSIPPSVHRHNLVSATRLTVFKGFWWNFPVIVSMTWRWSYFIKVMLDCFLPELWPINIFFNSKSCLCNSSCSFQWILTNPFNYYSDDLKRIILYRGQAWLLFVRVMALCLFYPVYQQMFLSPQLLLYSSVDFNETLKLCFRWSEEDLS